jgi:hypothetical protein
VRRCRGTCHLYRRSAGPRCAGWRARADALTVTVPATSGAPGYTINVTKSPFQITAERAGGTVMPG